MRRIITAVLSAILLLVVPTRLYAQTDTLRLSHLYTTHIRFSGNLSYVDISAPSVMSALIPDQNRNVLAIKAQGPFSTPASVTAIEESGRITTFYVIWSESPDRLVVDLQGPSDRIGKEPGASGRTYSVAQARSSGGRDGAPSVLSVLDVPRTVFHIFDRQFGVEISCENVLVHDDVIYFVLSIVNRSGISYQSGTPTFMMESSRRSGGRSGRKRSVVNDGTIVTARSMTGSLSVASGQSSRMALCFDKLTLGKGQMLGIYVYEEGGQRNLRMRLTADEVNRAASL